jgi:hypothetical protein
MLAILDQALPASRHFNSDYRLLKVLVNTNHVVGGWPVTRGDYECFGINLSNGNRMDVTKASVQACMEKGA